MQCSSLSWKDPWSKHGSPNIRLENCMDRRSPCSGLEPIGLQSQTPLQQAEAEMQPEQLGAA